MYYVETGDCRELMKQCADESADAIITDPPYELNFMNHAWDRSGIAFDPDTWREAYRLLKPGGYLLAFGGSRTFHRIAVAIEDAGFEIRDTLSWLYGSGFPKSYDISKAIDKMAGAEREVIGDSPYASRKPNGSAGVHSVGLSKTPGSVITAPATDDAKKWKGFGTALKPAWEPIIVARKPFKGTVAANVLEHGTGALNIDASRIEGSKPAMKSRSGNRNQAFGMSQQTEITSGMDPNVGRWPANVILDEQAAELLDEQTGILPSGFSVNRNRDSEEIANQVLGARKKSTEDAGYGDSGGASRFFYTAKVSKRERNRGVSETNTHSTVKPVSLMRYLVRLVTPPGGIVFDPFVGSGSTGIAAVLEGFDFVGFDLEADHVRIATERIQHAVDAPDEWKATA